MEFTVDKNGLDGFVNNINSILTNKLSDNVGKFVDEVNKLSNEGNFTGTAAYENIGKLCDCCSSYVNYYNDLVSEIKKNFNTYVNGVSDIIIHLRGSSIDVSSIKPLNLVTPKKNEGLKSMREHMKPDLVAKNYQNLWSYQESICANFDELFTLFNEIGNTSKFFNTSARPTNEAENFKGTVQNEIVNLKKSYTSSLNNCIDNIGISRDVIVNG